MKSATRDFLIVLDEDETDAEKAEGVNSLSFESTIPSKFMIGTDKGKVISCRMQPKQGAKSLILSTFDDNRRCKVMSVDRNPFFLSTSSQSGTMLPTFGVRTLRLVP